LSLPLPGLASELETLSLVIEVGGVPVRVNTSSPEFFGMLEDRYAGFISASQNGEIEFDVDIVQPGSTDPDADVQVTQRSGVWRFTRGDFRAEWSPASGHGWIRQSANPYSIDSVLRIVHTLVLARQNGFLLHAASSIRNGKAFLFAGISYVRKRNQGYIAFGTPFAGELAKVGENVSAPIEALYLLAKGPENRIEPISQGEAVRSLLANVLFFAEEQEFVRAAFDAAFEFVSRIPVLRLTFVPDSRVWELIG
jgi:hypothetical protein